MNLPQPLPHRQQQQESNTDCPQSLPQDMHTYNALLNIVIINVVNLQHWLYFNLNY